MEKYKILQYLKSVQQVRIYEGLERGGGDNVLRDSL